MNFSSLSQLNLFAKVFMARYLAMILSIATGGDIDYAKAQKRNSVDRGVQAPAKLIQAPDNRNGPHAFETTIMPLFSKFGCNAAECHGAATGQGDFKLSLFGGDPERDYQSVVEHLGGRRVNLLSPQKSLLLTKPTDMLAHGGGEIFDKESMAALRLSRWIQSGAPRGAKSSVTGIDLKADRHVIRDAEPLQIEVFAKSKSRRWKVTQDATFSSTNPSAVKVDEQGNVQVLHPGRYAVIAKYLGFSQVMTLTRPFASLPETVIQPPKRVRESTNPIDSATTRTLSELNLPWPKPLDDSRYVRRLYLDLTGRLPTQDQSQKYVRDQAPEKKARLVEELMNSDAFIDHWSYWIRKVIRFRVPGTDRVAAQNLNAWIRQSLEKEIGWSELTEQLLTATGDTLKLPQANYHRLFTDARTESEGIALSFLGVRIGCANCHNHPLDKWTQEDYHGMAAIFATLQRGKNVVEIPNGKVIQPKTALPAVPRIPGVNNLKSVQGAREEFSAWMTDSPLFRRAFVNRIWKHFMGKGIVEPVDDFRVSNPPVDKRLLTMLGEEFVRSEYKIKPLIRMVVMSELYASQAESGGGRQISSWAGVVLKKMPLEVFADVSQELLLGKLKVSAIRSLEPGKTDSALSLIKGCTARECNPVESPAELGLREKLHLLNGDFLNRWVHSEKNVFCQRLDRETFNTILSDFYWSAFSRSMSNQEERFWDKAIQEPESRSEKTHFLQDVIWALMNSSEFQTIR